jgi:hypothetical protein
MKIAACMLCTLLCAGSVWAHPDRPANIGARIDRQEHSIRQGVESGALTVHEARLLREEHRHIRKLWEIFLHDGRLTHRERTILLRKLNAAGRHLQRARHNARRSDYDVSEDA